MFHPVGDYEPGYPEAEVIQSDLVKDLPADLNGRGFAFDQEYRFTLPVMSQDVRALFHSVKAEFLFHRDQGGRKSFLPYEVHQEILPDPFLRCQHDILPADGIKNHGSSVLGFYSEGISW